MFFDDFPRFSETSGVGPGLERLNLRHTAMIDANSDILSGARVLDLACHDGRWSFAALQAGAAHVTGVEARPELVDNANATFAHYGAAQDSYEFICADVFDALNNKSFDVDVVFCFGYIYHTTRFSELLYRLRRLDPTYLIVDSHVMPGEAQPVVRVRTEPPEPQGTAVLDEYAHGGKTLVGRPSVSALRLMLDTYDFGIEEVFDWPSLLARNPDVEELNDYRNGGRVTLRCRTGARSVPVRTAPRATAAAPVDGGQAPGADGVNGQDAPEVRQGWRGLVNGAIAKATGYELRKADRATR